MLKDFDSLALERCWCGKCLADMEGEHEEDFYHVLRTKTAKGETLRWYKELDYNDSLEEMVLRRWEGHGNTDTKRKYSVYDVIVKGGLDFEETEKDDGLDFEETEKDDIDKESKSERPGYSLEALTSKEKLAIVLLNVILKDH